MSKEPGGLRIVRGAAQQRIKASRPDATNESPSALPVREKSTLLIPEFRSDFLSRIGRQRLEQNHLIGATDLACNRGQHFGFERQGAIESDIQGGQRPRSGVVDGLVMCGRIVHAGFVARAEGGALVKS